MARFLTALFLTLTLSAAQGQQSLVDILLGSNGGAGTTNNNNNNNNIPSSGTQQTAANNAAVPFLDTNALVPQPTPSSSSSSPSFSSSLLSSSPAGGMNQGTLRYSVGGGLGAGLSGGSQQQGHCTSTEKNLLFQNCAMSFGMQHMNYFAHLRRRRTCDVKVFSCGQVDTLIRCVNSQPIRDVSNRCWPVVDDALTGFLHQYRLPCSFQDLKRNCQQKSADLLPIDRRQQQGQGINYNPMTVIRGIVMRRVMPMIMMSMMRGGAFGA
ncbi:hypothetical protein ACOMHN_036960 [Nucella lapillus]